MFRKSILRRTMSLLVVTAMFLSMGIWGCSPQTSPEPPTSQQPAGTTPAPAETPPAAPQKEGGVLTLGIGLNPTALGYAPEMKTYQEFLIGSTALESLGRHDASGTMQPWLAESWQSDAEAKTVTVKLKKGISFHDGTAFNAEAVKWNMDQFVESGRAEASGLASTEVVDEFTVRFNLAKWNSSLMDSLFYFVLMSSPTAFNQNGKDWAVNNPVGTGPFKFDRWDRDVSVKFSKFDGYWQEGKPYLDAVEWRIISDPMTAMASLKAKEVIALANVQPDIARQLEGSDVVIKKLETGLGAMSIGFNGDSVNPDSPFSDVRVRKALSYAVDAGAITDSILHGYAIVTNQWGVPASWCFNPDVDDYAYNPEKARQLLAEAGYPDGFKTKLTTINSTMEVQVMTAVQGYLAEVGIDAEMELIETAHYREITMAGAEPWEGLILYRGRGDPDIVTYMPRNFSSDGVLMVNGLVTSDKVDRLLADAAAAPDFETLRQIAFQLQKEIYEEQCIITPLFVLSMPVAMYPTLHDSGFNEAQASLWTPADAWIEK